MARGEKVLVKGYIAYERGYAPPDLDDLYLGDGVAKTVEQAIAWWKHDTGRDAGDECEVEVCSFTVVLGPPKKYRWTLVEVDE